MVRDGWGVRHTSDPPSSAEGSWLCPLCCARANIPSEGPTAGTAFGRERPRDHYALRVLVVDDQEPVLRATASLLSDFETVVAVGCANKALEMLSNGSRFDAVVSDVMMPEMSGADLYARCFVHSPDVARRFVLASGEPAVARELLAGAMKRVGASHAPLLLEKPMSRDTLVAAVLRTAACTVPRSGTYSIAWENDGDPGQKIPG